jgi:hypothetical protein
VITRAICCLVLTATAAAAQTADDARFVAGGHAGYARVWDDEGLLGTGMALGGSVGYRVRPRVTIQATVERVPYHREVEYLTFDGRALFGLVEAVLQSSRPQLRPFAGLGVGMMHDERVWIRRTIDGPGRTATSERLDLQYTLAVMALSAGVDLRLSARASVRAGVRVHGLLDTGDDLAPHLSLQPTLGFAWRW